MSAPVQRDASGVAKGAVVVGGVGALLVLGLALSPVGIGAGIGAAVSKKGNRVRGAAIGAGVGLAAGTVVALLSAGRKDAQP